MERNDTVANKAQPGTSNLYFDESTGGIFAPDGQHTLLRPQTARVMQFLIEHRGQIVSRNELLSAIWPSTCVTDDSVTQCVREIRKALGDSGHRLLKTYPKRGYLLDLASGIDAPAPATRTDHTSYLLPLASLILFLVVVGLLSWQHTPSLPEKPQIAIHPFQSLTPSDTWSRIGAGLAQEVSAALARSDWIDVHQVGSPAVSAAQSPAHRLDGTIAGGDDDVRVSVRFLDNRSGRILWSERWSAPQTGLFDIQTNILEKVEASIASAWTGVVARERLSAINNTTQHLGAFDLYLRAIELKHRFTPASLTQSQRYLEQALAIDPDYARAWTALAVVHLLQMEFAASREAFDEHLLQRIRATEKAVALSQQDPEALIQSTFLLGRDHDYIAAEQALRDAVALAWNNPDILAQAAWGGSRRVPVGLDAVAWAKRAFELNDAPPPWYYASLATAAFYAREYDLAADAYAKAPPMTEVLYRHAATRAFLGDLEHAQALLAHVYRKLPNDLSIAQLEAADGNTYPAHVEQLSSLLDGIPVTSR